jgi:hypothetical protein
MIARTPFLRARARSGIGARNFGVDFVEMMMKRQLQAILISSSLAVSVFPAVADDLTYRGVTNVKRVDTVGTTNKSTGLSSGRHLCYLSRVRLSSPNAECKVTRGSSTWTVSARVRSAGADAYCSAICYRLDDDSRDDDSLDDD